MKKPLVRPQRLRIVATFAVLALVAAGCGGDDAGNGDSAGTEDIDLAAFCEGSIQGEARFIEGPELDDQGNPAEGSLEELRADVEPHLEAIEENTPEEIQSEVEQVLESVRAALEDGDTAETETPEFLQAETALDEYVYDNCDFDAKQEFAAVDYAYEEVPDTLEAGRAAFRMNNRGDELHEAVIFRIADNEQRPIEELLKLPEDQAQPLLEFRGVAIAEPGSTGYTSADLQAGRYGMVCFIPVGTESFEDLPDDEEPEGASPGATGSPTGAASPTTTASPTAATSPTGTGSPTSAASPTATGSPGAGGEAPAHFTRGMFAEFTVS